MILIIAGSRTIYSFSVVKRAFIDFVDEYGLPDKIVSGFASGVDKLGIYLALSLKIPIQKFPANWAKYGKKAGPMRNRNMAEYADALLLIWDGKSKGSKNMLESAKSEQLIIKEVIV